MSPYNRS